MAVMESKWRQDACSHSQPSLGWPAGGIAARIGWTVVISTGRVGSFASTSLFGRAFFFFFQRCNNAHCSGQWAVYGRRVGVSCAMRRWGECVRVCTVTNRAPMEGPPEQRHGQFFI